MLDSFVAEGRNRIQIENICNRFLEQVAPEHLQNTNPLDVERLIDSNLSKYCDIRLELVKALPQGHEAELDILDRRIRFTEQGWQLLCEGNVRSRFTGCHEVYHAIDHLPQIDVYSEQFLESQLVLARYERPIYRNPEWQAEHGAGVLLMPAVTIVPYYRSLESDGFKESYIIDSIVDRYEVSEPAAVARLRALRKDNYL